MFVISLDTDTEIKQNITKTRIFNFTENFTVKK